MYILEVGTVKYLRAQGGNEVFRVSSPIGNLNLGFNLTRDKLICQYLQIFNHNSKIIHKQSN